MARRHIVSALIVFCLLSTFALGQTATPSRQPDALLSIDQHRVTVIDRIVTQWGDQLATSSGALKPDQLRTMLDGLRADHLLAASLAGTLDGLRDVLAVAVTAPVPLRDRITRTKALGDTSDDVVYTPVTPCRLVDTRSSFAAVYQGAGAFAPGEIRNYSLQGGNGVCLTQLPAGLNPSAVQLQVFGIPISSGSNGDVEVLPQGSSFGSTATLVYLGSELLTSASTTARTANNQIGVQVRGGGANLAIDVVGYFKAPSGSGPYFVNGGNAFGTAAKIGTLDNQALTVVTNNQPTLRLIPATDANHTNTVNVINGSPLNSVGPFRFGATIAGGGVTIAGTNYPNQVTGSGSYAAIGGGYANTADGLESTIGGGSSNTSSGIASTVAGGSNNNASGDDSAIAGGFGNTTGVVGTSNGLNSTVGGGSHNTASGDNSTVVGGILNAASGNYSTVGGGSTNIASGPESFVAGGVLNEASGATSFAGGYRAKARGNGSFIWADSLDFDFVNPVSSANVFAARATGGVAFYLGFNGSGGVTWSCIVQNGASGWSCTSDRNAKENLTAADTKAVLNRVVALPVYTWNGKGVDPHDRHLGPMAQDFYSAFGLGLDNTRIASGDLSSVSLVAIQGLYELLEEKGARIAELEQQVTELQLLRGELAAIKATMVELASGKNKVADR